jgi:hypothetical protein
MLLNLGTTLYSWSPESYWFKVFELHIGISAFMEALQSLLDSEFPTPREPKFMAMVRKICSWRSLGYDSRGCLLDPAHYTLLSY